MSNKDTPCRYFALGKCKYGTSCQFLHSATAVVPPHSDTHDAKGSKNKRQDGHDLGAGGADHRSPSSAHSPSPPPCKFFARGTCNKKNSCHFSHSIPSDSAVYGQPQSQPSHKWGPPPPPAPMTPELANVPGLRFGSDESGAGAASAPPLTRQWSAGIRPEQLKIVTWNIENMGRMLRESDVKNPTRRRKRVAQEIRSLQADVLCICEGPATVAHLRTFCEIDLSGDYTLVERANTKRYESDRKTLTQMYGNSEIAGDHWVWFLVRTSIISDFNGVEVSLEPLETWRALTGGSDWPIHYWGDMTSRRHMHLRHPQVLKLSIEGVDLRFIGCHFKSKHIHSKIRPHNEDGTLAKDYVDHALRARIKLATEAVNIRTYIDKLFEVEGDPIVFVMGDLNDGPGKEIFEREYLFFNLLANLQGDVFFARRFLNHALFNEAEESRWTCQFNDLIDAKRQQKVLLDHILFTQNVAKKCNSKTAIVIGHSGMVEHDVHMHINQHDPKDGPYNRLESSDHTPISVRLKLHQTPVAKAQDSPCSPCDPHSPPSPAKALTETKSAE